MGKEISNLQKHLATITSQAMAPTQHHPITCLGGLRLEEDGTLRCPHNATVRGGDRRTKDCINGSVAILIVELAATL